MDYQALADRLDAQIEAAMTHLEDRHPGDATYADRLKVFSDLLSEHRQVRWLIEEQRSAQQQAALEAQTPVPAPKGKRRTKAEQVAEDDGA